MRYEIEPYVGVGPIKFGMAPSEVEEVVGCAPVKFKKGLDSSDSDHYQGFFVYYEDGGCGGIELYEGEVFLRGVGLLGPPYPETLAALAEMDPGLLCRSDGCTSIKYGVALYVPNAKSLCESEEEPPEVEGALAFALGTYDDLLKDDPGILGEPVSELRARGLLG